MDVSIVEVQPNTYAHATLMTVAGVLNQAKYITVYPSWIDTAFLLGAFRAEQCLGFLYCLVQVIGREEGRPPVPDASGRALREGFVEAFGVLPAERRHGLGQLMQEQAIARCQQLGCYQIRSRSPISSRENYALKLKMGYTLHPSLENDSYYFTKLLVPEVVNTVEKI